ncbi:hypothetical protein ACWEN3_09735 [Streptomyces sp. NPDC004561]
MKLAKMKGEAEAARAKEEIIDSYLKGFQDERAKKLCPVNPGVISKPGANSITGTNPGGSLEHYFNNLPATKHGLRPGHGPLSPPSTNGSTNVNPTEGQK